MRLLFIGQGRFVKYHNSNAIYPSNKIFNYDYYRRYLEVFDEIILIERLWLESGRPLPDVSPTTGPRLSFIGLPPFIGIKQFLVCLPHIHKTLSKAIGNADAFLMRVPNYYSFFVRRELQRLKLPYAVEVVGDPWDVFSPGAINHPMRRFFRFFGRLELRLTCARACAAAYVTERTLQLRYPPNKNAFTTSYSSIDLPLSYYAEKPRHYTRPAQRLVFVGTLEVLYKAPDILLHALHILAQQGFRPQLIMVGGGRCQAQMEALTHRLNLSEQVSFRGKIPNSEVFAILNTADLFILPSRQEGLPRAIIEAMARGLPCIGSTAGGIPELLPAEDLVPPGDAQALAAKIRVVATDPNRLTRMSARNLEQARKYSAEVLRAKRQEFYRYLRTIAARGREN